MTRCDRLWLAGVIWTGLGVAADKVILNIAATAVFLLALWLDKKDDSARTTDPD